MTSKLLFNETFLVRLERLALVFRSAASSRMQGERRSSRRGQSVEFADFRPYTIGDDFRRIDWNAYARLERLFIKLFVEEEEITIHLLVDNSHSMDWGEPHKLEYAVRAAAAIGYIALVNLDRISASTLFSTNKLSKHLTPLRGKKSALRLFNFMQSILPGEIIESVDRILLSHLPAETNMVLLFSDLMGDSWLDTAGFLRSRGHEVSIIHVLSPDELKPVLSGDFRLQDSEKGAEIEVTADFETLQHYQSHLQDWQENWKTFCTSRGINYIPVSTSLPLEELLFSWLPSRGLLK